ncbi:hypothetical protein M3Y94_00760100 [Aphelenchoides besseyi]|nr:hypothetical protein M3Y94_00760100 [Aphelenchoides besseyi]KAI6232160.1 Allatostatin-A receptor [Aphelenchoides besseyi]
MLLLCLVFLLIIVIGFIGNSIVLFVIAVNRQLHDSNNILIACLASADLLFLLGCVPLTAFSYAYTWIFSDHICRLMIMLQYTTCFVSCYTLALLAFERYLSITSPTKLKSIRRRKNAIYACIGVWILMLILNWPTMRAAGVIEQEFNGTIERYCVDSVEIGSGSASLTTVRLFFWGFNFGAYILPLAMCSVFYGLLLKALYKDRLVISKSSQKMKRHATKMVLALICIFGALWFPQNLRFFLRALNYPELSFWEHNENLLLFVQSAAQTLAYSNSCINPILYGVLSERFRTVAVRTWSRVLGCSKRRSSSDAYYKQTLFTRNLYDSKACSPDQRRSINDSRNPTVVDSPSFMNSLDVTRTSNSVQITRPLIPRNAVVERENVITVTTPMQNVTEDSIAVLL